MIAAAISIQGDAKATLAAAREMAIRPAKMSVTM